MHTTCTTLHNKDLVVTEYLTKILWLTLSPVVRLSHTVVIHGTYKSVTGLTHTGLM